jgi:hypothetical protein
MLNPEIEAGSNITGGIIAPRCIRRCANWIESPARWAAAKNRAQNSTAAKH